MRSSFLIVLLLLTMPVFAEETDPETWVNELADPSLEVRERARAQLLAAKEAAVPALRKGIASANRWILLGCLDVAGEAGLRRARAAVLERASNPAESPLVRRAAIRALRGVGDYRDLKFLAGLLADWPEAALALAGIGDEDAIPALRERLAGSEVPPEVAYALVILGDREPLAVLVEQTGREGNEGLRAVSYLRAYSGRDVGSTREAWISWLRVEGIATSLGAEDWEQSEAAYAALFEGKNDAERRGLAADLLVIARDTSRSRDQRTKAVRALGETGAKELVPSLVDLLFEDPDGLIRVYAAESIGRLGRMDAAIDLVWYLVNDEEVFRKLSAKNLSNPYYTVDSAVSRALVRLGVIGGLEYMIRQLGQSHRVRVYHQAVRTLKTVTGKDFGFRPDARTADRLAAAGCWREWFDEHRGTIVVPESPGLADSEYRRRVRELVDGLGQWKFLSMSRARQKLYLLGETVVPELIAGLTRPEVHIRTHCAELLGWLRARNAREALARSLADPRFEVRTAAAAALAAMGPGEATGDLLEVLEDPTADMFDVRIEAVLSLARATGSVAVPAINAALARKENDSETFRREAWFALAAHGDTTALDRLGGMLDREEIAWRQVVALRIKALTGQDPGVTTESIAAFREWWKVNWDRYTPRQPYGTDG